ncbi:MAG: LamG-like jellyroll fold domain-containing protein, partial [Kiritimatiellia bacterium]|nr:LamG-like jellyroll fold domain-containing protein [Kiritimatiellia bacterium]
CMDGAMGATPVPFDEWHTVAMSYDGLAGTAWYDGRLDARPGLNPYPMPGGLHDGGPRGSDFTVGAVHRSGEMGNFFRGRISGIAVYRRALTPAEHFALAHGIRSDIGSPELARDLKKGKCRKPGNDVQRGSGISPLDRMPFRAKPV